MLMLTKVRLRPLFQSFILLAARPPIRATDSTLLRDPYVQTSQPGCCLNTSLNSRFLVLSLPWTSVK